MPRYRHMPRSQSCRILRPHHRNQKDVSPTRHVHFKEMSSNSQVPTTKNSSEGKRSAPHSGGHRVSIGDITDLTRRHHHNGHNGSPHIKVKLNKHSSRFKSNKGDNEEPEDNRMMSGYMGRRGTVHGNQIHFSNDARSHRRHTDGCTGRTSRAVSAREKKAQLCYRKFRMWGKVIGSWCLLQRHILAKHQSDPIYQTQLDNIGKNSPTEKGSYGSNRIDLSYFTANTQMRMSQKAIQILTKPPHERTPDDIKYAMNALRNVKYIAEFPLKIQGALAKVGYVECFEAKRFVVKEGGAPENAYIVLYGSILTAILDDHRSSATSVNELIGRGQPFGLTEILPNPESPWEIGVIKNKARGGTNITAEYTELLRIPSVEFMEIFMGGAKMDPEFDPFLKKFSFLRLWPLKALKDEPGKYFITYFQRNVTLTKDSTKSDWIYLVKEGSLRVLKKLEKVKPCVNKRTGKYNDTAHTNGYLSFLTRDTDFDRFASYHELKLPPPLEPDTDSVSDGNDSNSVYSSGDLQSLNAVPLLKKLNHILRPHTARSMLLSTPSGREKRPPRSAASVGTLDHDYQISTPELTISPRLDVIDEKSDKDEANQVVQRTIKKKTIFDDWDDGNSKDDADAFIKDPQWVHVQTLTKDQSFGLQYVIFEADKEEEQPSFVVVSNGAEVVQISRQLFNSKLDMNLKERLRSEISPYPTNEELQANLGTRINWESYKDILMGQIKDEHTRKNPARYRQKSAPSKSGKIHRKAAFGSTVH